MYSGKEKRNVRPETSETYICLFVDEMNPKWLSAQKSSKTFIGRKWKISIHAKHMNMIHISVNHI